MKKVLVTGAGGTIGLQVIRFLLSEGKYEITALELRDKHVYKRLKAYRKRINIVYSDVNDELIVDALVKDHDIVIHLAGVLPPFANVKDDLCKVVDYSGTVNIVNAIRNYNPNCYLLYASSTSVYGKSDKDAVYSVKSECNIDDFDFYSNYKIKAEDYIKNNIKNFTIFRLSYVLGDPGRESLIYNLGAKEKIETISSEDAGYAFVAAIDFVKELNKKTFNVSGGDKFRTTFREYLLRIFTTYGLSIRFLSTFIFADKNYFGGYYSDSDKLEEILHFRSKNLDVYYQVLDKYRSKVSRFIPRILALPFVFYLKRKK